MAIKELFVGINKHLDTSIPELSGARPDAPDAVVMSLDHYNNLIETVHLLKSPANAAHLARSIAQLRSGQASPQQLIENENTHEDSPVHP